MLKDQLVKANNIYLTEHKEAIETLILQMESQLISAAARGEAFPCQINIDGIFESEKNLAVLQGRESRFLGLTQSGYIQNIVKLYIMDHFWSKNMVKAVWLSGINVVECTWVIQYGELKCGEIDD